MLLCKKSQRQSKQKAEADLRMFHQHGFIKHGENENHVIGSCPFCQKGEHFYINKFTRQWDCKRCGSAGGTQIFLQMIAKHCRQFFTGKIVKALADNRGLAASTLRKAGIGFNPLTNEYLLPVPKAGEPDKLTDIRHCKLGKPLMSTTGCSMGLYGWGEQLDKCDTVWLCEGEWDKLTMDQAVVGENECAVAVPGAGTLKNEWLQLFGGKNVIACYDNDEAGEVGAVKAYKKLSPIVKSIKFVNWPETASDGHDIRDEFKVTSINLRKKIDEYTKPIPKGIENDFVAIAQSKSNDETKQPEGPGMMPEEVYANFKKWLHMPDDLLLDIIFGTVIAHRIQGDPVWVFVVGPPGSGKTEPLDALTGAHNIVCKSTLTSKSLVSGQFAGSGIEPSLLPRLHGKVLIVKDFTTVLTLRQDEMQELRGILRDSYDGKFERDYGNGKLVRWITHYGFLAGVTAAIEHHASMSAAFGERFLNYHLPLGNTIKERREFVMRSHDNVGSELQMKKELQDTAIKTLMHCFNLSISETAEQRAVLTEMALCTSKMRGTVPRDRFTKEVVNSAYYELGTRLVKQYTKLARGISAFHRSDVIVDRAVEAVRRIAIGSIPGERRKVIEFLYNQSQSNEPRTTTEIAEAVELPVTPTCDRLLHDLLLLRIVKREKSVGFTGKYIWSLEDEMFESLGTSGILKPIPIGGSNVGKSIGKQVTRKEHRRKIIRRNQVQAK